MTAPRVEGPAWMDAKYFDMVAKSPAGAPDTEMKPMLQAFLKDRFRLVAHVERREMSVYNLVVLKGGIKMSLAPAPQVPPNPAYKAGHPTIVGNLTSTQLAGALTNLGIGRPVLDKTALDGRYVLTLEFSPLSAEPDVNASELRPPDIFTALQQQLGLKLEAGKDMLDIVVVDQVERSPSEN
jgi:uncharacterized protein (TIGR03435 family)